MRRFYWSLFGTVVLVGALVVAGCGSEEPTEDPLECGVNTALEDGYCVPESRCDEGEIVSPRGVCEPEDVFCGESSIYDAELEICVALEGVECGPGTIENEGRCVLEDPLHCGEGTVLADEVCELSEEICGEGTELEAPYCELSEDACDEGTQWDVVNGECVDLEDVSCGEETIEKDDACVPVGSFVDELAADADIDYADGEAITPTDGEQFVFTGSLKDDLNQSFELEGQEGQWLEVTIYPRGLPSVGFDMVDGDGLWKRSMVAGMESAPSRTVLIPTDDTYELSVTTYVAESGTAEDFDTEHWQYVGVVEVVEAPDPYEWDFSTEELDGDLSHPEYNFIAVGVEDVDEILFAAQALGEDVEEATLEVWESPQEFSKRHDLEVGDKLIVGVDELSTVYLHLDAAAFYGARSDFELTGLLTDILEPDDIYTEEIAAEAGELIFLSHHNSQHQEMKARVFLEGALQKEVEVLANNQDSYAADETNREAFYAQESGEYVVEFENTSSDEVTGFLSASYAASKPTFEVDSKEPSQFEASIDADGAAAGDWKYAVIDAPGPSAIDVAVDADVDDVPYLGVYDLDGEAIAEDAEDGEVYFLTETQDVFVAVIRPSSSAEIDGGIDITMEGRPLEIIEPGEVYEKQMDVDAFDLLHGYISYAEGDQMEVRLINPNGVTLFEEIEVELGEGEELSVMELFPGPGEFTLEIENTGDLNLVDIRAEIEIWSPIDSVMLDEEAEPTYERDPLVEGESEVIIVQPTVEDYVLSARAVMNADQLGAFRIWDIEDGSLLAEGEDMLTLETRTLVEPNQMYAVEFEAVTDLDDGYDWTLSLEEFEEFELSETSEPGLVLLEGDSDGVEDTIHIDSCPTIQGIDLDVEMVYSFPNELVFKLTSPGGEERILWARGSNTTGGVVGNFNETIEPETGTAWDGDSAEPIEVFEGFSGTGDWTLHVSNHYEYGFGGFEGDFESWTLNLVCEG